MQKLNKKNCVSFTGCLFLTALLLVGCAGENDLEITSGGDAVAATEEDSSRMQENLQESGGQDTMQNTEARERDSGQETEPQMTTGQEDNQTPGGGADSSFIYVQITGAVRWPGVYEMPAGSRVFEVVEKAGGMLEEAEPTAVNQATALTDGQMVHIYTREEWQEALQSRESSDTAGMTGGVNDPEEDDGRVNINTADKEQLCSIPGIGEARAESILTYRQEHGAFGSIEEIKNVSGIKDGLFQKIKDKIKV